MHKIPGPDPENFKDFSDPAVKSSPVREGELPTVPDYSGDILPPIEPVTADKSASDLPKSLAGNMLAHELRETEELVPSLDEMLKPDHLQTVITDPGFYTQGIMHEAQAKGKQVSPDEVHKQVLVLQKSAINKIVKPEAIAQSAGLTRKKVEEDAVELYPRAEAVLNGLPDSKPQGEIDRGLITLFEMTDKLQPNQRKLKRMLEDPSTSIPDNVLASYRAEMAEFLSAYRLTSTKVTDGIADKNGRVKALSEDAKQMLERTERLDKDLERDIDKINESKLGGYNPDIPVQVEQRGAISVTNHVNKCEEDTDASQRFLTGTENGLQSTVDILKDLHKEGDITSKIIHDMPVGGTISAAVDMLIEAIKHVNGGQNSARAIALNALGNLQSMTTKIMDSAYRAEENDKGSKQRINEALKAIDKLKSVAAA